MKTEVIVKDRETSKIIEITFFDGSLARIAVFDNSNALELTYVDNKPLVQPKAANQILIWQQE